MVSDKNIKRILGKEVLIYPLIPENIEGASIFLTASQLAWSLKSKKLAISDDGIVVPASDCIIIMSNESVALSLKYSGICFPRVPNATRGLISCTTYVKPGWVGKLAIVICNPTSNDQTIQINDPICVLSIVRLESRSSQKDIERKGVQFTIQMLKNLGISVSPKEETDISNNTYSNFKDMKYELVKSDTFIKFKEKNKTSWGSPINFLIVATTIILIPLLILTIRDLINGVNVAPTLCAAVIAGLFVLLQIKMK